MLHLGEENDARGTTALGTHGMGGVGKTTALKCICREKVVQEAYRDGVCFMELGQDANSQTVRYELVRCVRNLGGAKLANELEELSGLGKVAARVADWVKDRAVLLCCTK